MNAFNEENMGHAPSAGEMIEKVKSAACERCSQAKDIVVKNPVPTVLGALVFGAAIGYLIYTRREEASLYERLASDAKSLRKQLGGAPDRLSDLLHEGVGRASRKAHKASDYIHDLPAAEVIDSVSHSLHRLANRLKFW